MDLTRNTWQYNTDWILTTGRLQKTDIIKGRDEDRAEWRSFCLNVVILLLCANWGKPDMRGIARRCYQTLWAEQHLVGRWERKHNQEVKLHLTPEGGSSSSSSSALTAWCSVQSGLLRALSWFLHAEQRLPGRLQPENEVRKAGGRGDGNRRKGQIKTATLKQFTTLPPAGGL